MGASLVLDILIEPLVIVLVYFTQHSPFWGIVQMESGLSGPPLTWMVPETPFLCLPVRQPNSVVLPAPVRLIVDDKIQC